MATVGRDQANKVDVFVGETWCGTRITAGWSLTCLWTLSHWQKRHAIAIRVTDLAICGQQNLAVMRHCIADTPGWWMECRDWKTASRICAGTRG